MAPPRLNIAAFCAQVCRRVRFRPDHEAITAELTEHMEDRKAALLAAHPDLTLWEAERQAVAAMGDPEEIGRELDKSHSPLLGWFHIWFFRASMAVLVLALLFALPRAGEVASSLLEPPVYGSMDHILENYVPEERATDFRPEGSWTWKGYTFSVHRAVVLEDNGSQSLYYLLKASHSSPWDRGPAIRDWLWAEDDLGNLYPSWEHKELLEEQGYSHTDFGDSGGNPTAEYPFSSYYSLWVTGIPTEARSVTLHFDRYGEDVLRLTVPLRGGNTDD